jgi:hypothetical protein
MLSPQEATTIIVGSPSCSKHSPQIRSDRGLAHVFNWQSGQVYFVLLATFALRSVRIQREPESSCYAVQSQPSTRAPRMGRIAPK